MESDHKTQIREVLQILWKHARQSSARIPTKGWIAAGLVLALGLGLIVRASFSRDATLRFRLQHGFRSAQVSLWIDGDLVYSGKVAGSLRKRFGVIPDGSLQGVVSQVIPISSGEHRIKIRVEPEDGSTQESVITGEFASHGERTLSANARRGNVSLSWGDDGSSERVSASGEESGSSSSGVGRYVSWLLLTMAGSLVSALTGYAVKELPGILRARQGADPKTPATN